MNYVYNMLIIWGFSMLSYLTVLFYLLSERVTFFYGYLGGMYVLVREKEGIL